MESEVVHQFSSERPEGELLLTIEEAARYLRIGRTKMCSLLATGEVESVYIGRLRRVPVECIQEYVSALRDKARHVERAA
jgi:excisionase family DNA binding protein